jgi:dTDP-4-amino-4,6-dideoxygalactose transaminase
MVVTDDQVLAEKLAVLRTHGSVRGDAYLSFVAAGFNYRLSDVNAAIGIAQMKRLKGLLDVRRSLAVRLSKLLTPLSGVRPPIEPAYAFHTYQSYVVLLDEAIDRDAIIARMRQRDIEATLGTYSLQAQPVYQGTPSAMRQAAPVSARVHRSALSLPLHPRQSEEDLERVAEALAESLRHCRQ